LIKPAQGKVDLTIFREPNAPGDASGDLIHTSQTADGQVQIILMDGNGHGLETARDASVPLLTRLDDIVARTQGVTTGETLAAIDRVAEENEMIACASAVRYDPATRKLEGSESGDTNIYILYPDGRAQKLQPRAGAEIGTGVFYDEMRYSPEHVDITLPPGAKVIIATDGVTDRFEQPGKVSGQAGFIAFLESCGSDPEKISQGIRNAKGVGTDDTTFAIFSDVRDRPATVDHAEVSSADAPAHLASNLESPVNKARDSVAAPSDTPAGSPLDGNAGRNDVRQRIENQEVQAQFERVGADQEAIRSAGHEQFSFNSPDLASSNPPVVNEFDRLSDSHQSPQSSERNQHELLQQSLMTAAGWYQSNYLMTPSASPDPARDQQSLS
jgi:hypothetical protein